jgi:hypothetical protein
MYGNGDYAAADAGAYPNGQADYGRPPGHRSARRPPGQRSLPLIGATKIPTRVLAAAGALVLVAVVATVAFWPSGGPKPQTGNHASSGPTTPVTSSVSTLTPVKATGFDPLNASDGGNENSQDAAYAIDRSPRSFWASQWYKSPEFGGLKTGAGLLIEMAKPVTFRSVTVTFGTVPPGSDVKLLVGNSDERSQANLSSMTTVASGSGESGKVTFRITSSAKGRFLVVWFTKLPPKTGPGSWYMAQVFNVTVRGIG